MCRNVLYLSCSALRRLPVRHIQETTLSMSSKSRSMTPVGTSGCRVAILVRYVLMIVLGCLAVPGLGSAAEQSRPAACAPDPVFAELERELELLALGRDLFYDPILSGNREVACATCHHPAFGTSDGLALGIGDGGIGLGPGRKVDPDNVPEQRIPRNAPALFNLGYDAFSVLFHDGRVERLDDGSVRTPHGVLPATGRLPVLSAQARFPVLSPDEMAGQGSENEIAEAVARGAVSGPGGAHDLLAKRVEAIPAYRDRFNALGVQSVTYDAIAEALAAFTAHEWRADESPYDRFLCDGEPLSEQAEAGRKIFMGDAGCSGCHAGRFQTDHGFHAIAMPQIGPGKAEGDETHARDTGRMRVTGLAGDAYLFRTPSLRNVALTAPYGHAGAYPSLHSILRHHSDPDAALRAYDPGQVWLPELPGADDFRVLRDAGEVQDIAAANEFSGASLTDAEIDDLVAFLRSLTDRSGIIGRLGVPESVPSGLPVPRL